MKTVWNTDGTRKKNHEKTETTIRAITLEATDSEWTEMRNNMVRIGYILDNLRKIADEKTKEKAKKDVDDFNDVYMTIFG